MNGELHERDEGAEAGEREAEKEDDGNEASNANAVEENRHPAKGDNNMCLVYYTVFTIYSFIINFYSNYIY